MAQVAHPAGVGLAADAAAAARWRRRELLNVWGWRVFLGVVGAALFGPLLILVLFSFNDSTILTFPLEGFTTQWYTQGAGGPGPAQSVENSFGVAFVGGAALPRPGDARGVRAHAVPVPGARRGRRAWSARRSCCPG